MPFQIVHNDITKMNTEAIVNAANSKLIMGGGVCGAIFKAAGERELQDACNKIATCAVGHAVITKGYNLNAKYIIHAVGPIYYDGNINETEYLKQAYKNSLQLAKDNNIKSISFPLISSGIYKFPKKEALDIAINIIKDFLLYNEMDVYLVVFDRRAVSLSEELFNDISHYIDSYYEEERYNACIRCISNRDEEFSQIYKGAQVVNEEIINNSNIDSVRNLDSILNNISESFSQMILRLIDERGKNDVEIYKRANMDRKLFSKIRSNKDYNPKKSTAISLAIALELSLDETIDLLAKAGYTLSPSHKFDLIIQYFIKNRDYDIYKINEALFCFKQQLLSV